MKSKNTSLISGGQFIVLLFKIEVRLLLKEEPLFPAVDHSTMESYFRNNYGGFTPTSAMAMEEGIAESFRQVGNKTATQLNTFNRYYKIFPDDELGNIISYVFIVRPDLNMDFAVNSDIVYMNLLRQNPEIILNLTQDFSTNLSNYYELNGGTPDHHFVSFLTDRVQNYSIPDVNVKTFDIEQPYTNFHTVYASNSNESRTGAQFDITFRETKRLTVTKFFDAWVRYMDAIQLGRLSPKRKYVTSRILNGSSILDYATSVYLIDTLVDGGEIVYFHKTTGAFPITVPHSNWSFQQKGVSDSSVTIQFAGGLPEPLNPIVMNDFNFNSMISSDDETMLTENNYGNPIVGKPFITWNSTKNKYMLRWKPFSSDKYTSSGGGGGNSSVR